MPVKVTQAEHNAIYFCTFTCLKWLPLFEKTQLYDRIYASFDYLKDQGSPVLSYVIMPNHLHFMFYLSERSVSVNKVIGEMKRFLAYEVVKRLKEAGELELLEETRKSVPWYDRKIGKRHQVFEDSFDWKQCNKEEYILQKMEYMHRNPVSGKWNLADDYTLYPYSSAGYYDRGEDGLYQVMHYQAKYTGEEFLCKE